MKRYRVSKRAFADIEELTAFGISEFGFARTERYLDSMRETFHLLGRFPRLGRPTGSLRPGTRKIESGSHVVHYRVTPSGVVILRVFHRKTDVSRLQL